MTTRSLLIPIAALCLTGAVACGGGGGGGGGDGGTVAECDKAANVARRAEVLAAQPELVVTTSSARSVRTGQIGFASLAGDPTQICSIAIPYKDLNGDGALQPYEDWTLTPAARASDLANRMTAAQKRALMAHALLTDNPTPGAGAAPSAATNAIVDAGLRFGRTAANASQVVPRADWANRIQARAEASPLGIPFVLSMEPAHSTGNGRAKARSFSQWPNELGLGATGDLALIRRFGEFVSQEYRAIGVRMAFSPAGNLATDPRWFGSQLTFGEDPETVSSMVDAYVQGVQSTIRGQGVAVVLGHFPGAGAAKGGFDARLAKSKATVYPGNHFDGQVRAFERALGRGLLGVMPGYGIAEAGAWSGLSGLVNGATLEQVGASFSPTLLTTVLRGHYAFGGLVVAPEGVLADAGGAGLGAPWGYEGSTRAQRVAAAVAAGVDQFLGLNDTTDLDAAGLTGPQVDVAAWRALTAIFKLGLFENPYVDAAKAAQLVNSDPAYQAGLDAMNRGLVLIVNKTKPAGWLDAPGKGNAGNGTGRVLPAPPGEPYVSAGCSYYVAGDFNLDYVRSVSAGYGTMTNDAATILQQDRVTTCPAPTEAAKMALSDYVFIRIAAPYTFDPDSGFLGQALPSLTWAGNDPSVLAPVLAARQAIDALTTGCGSPSRTQIVVFVDSGRPSVVSELLSATYGISGLYLDWMGTYDGGNLLADKVALDVAFGIFNGRGKLPVGLPISDASAGAQQPDTAGDGQDATFVSGFGLPTNMFQ